ncbi:hypothetical protein EDC04DRAFT_2713527 [Pisolithus marmoratus]|nr:hypothetical protein EDC04DRAFT_2713527 [Pisolithus marmoratus]
MGIDVNSLREKKRQPEVQYWAGMKLIVGRDKLDEIQVGVHLAYATSSRRSNTSSRQTRSSRARYTSFSISGFHQPHLRYRLFSFK